MLSFSKKKILKNILKELILRIFAHKENANKYLYIILLSIRVYDFL